MSFWVYKPIGVLSLFLLPAISSVAAFPDRMTYQGLLLDGAVPVNGMRSIEARIYNVSAGGSPLFSQTFPSVQITDGVFSVTLTGLGASPHRTTRSISASASTAAPSSRPARS